MTLSDEELDRLLSRKSLQPPEEFTQSVLSALIEDTVPASTGFVWQDLAKWVGLGIGGFIGFTQTLYFVLGLWFATAAT